MAPDPQIIIVGSGPAGVSAAFPLVERGIRVLMVDAGIADGKVAGPGPMDTLQSSRRNPDQWKMVIGEEFQRFAVREALSPKLRSPIYSSGFLEYDRRYVVDSGNFFATGSLASGGCSNAWGASVSMFDDEDLRDFPVSHEDLSASYQRISRRIGVSGSNDDDMSTLHGHDGFLMPPIEPSGNLRRLHSRYRSRPQRALAEGVRMGYGRNAVLTRELRERKGCIYCGLCAWGCARKSIWSARYDLELLNRNPAFSYRKGYFATGLARAETGFSLMAESLSSGERTCFNASRIILACGAIGSAKLVLDALGMQNVSVPFQTSPAAGFALFLPSWRFAGLAGDGMFAMSQLTFKVDDPVFDKGYASGHIFPADSIPASEYLSFMPFSFPTSRKLIRLLQSSLLIGNCFFSGSYSRHRLRLRQSGSLAIDGDYSPAVEQRAAQARKRLAAAMRRYGVLLLPGSFRLTPPGGDMHYAATVPMRESPRPGEANARGEVQGLPGVYVVDGAALTSLPPKPHTFTIMANADRIATLLSAAGSSGLPTV